ncbi:methyltransferase domain-containing protein [Pendulispora albinea]|uniref:Methyltransferase domain-containing protein n=1 Tax=Pendulispora albinea TaxID=2741071 RepID=A0ABZ2LMQ3_9BACT
METASPRLFIDTIHAFRRTAMIAAAIRLDIFSHIAEGATTARALAQSVSVSPRGIRILCDCLAVNGFLSKRGDAYALTADAAAFLDRRSPTYLGSLADYIASDLQWEAFRDIVPAVRRGGTVLPNGGILDPDHTSWTQYARSMSPMLRRPAHEVARMLAGETSGRPVRVLDLAAGHGLFGIALAQANPRAQVVALDGVQPLAIARAHAEAAGVAERYTTLAGDARQLDFGGPYDLLLVANLLHCFDREACDGILRRLRASAAPGARLAIVDFVPLDDRTGSRDGVEFALIMLCLTPAGDAHTFEELAAMVQRAGFHAPELRPIAASPMSVVLAEARE